MTEYVNGFMFSLNRNNLLLIEKNRPEWQKGKLNGIGGKIEEGEKPVDAMVREFEEETGVKTDWRQWEMFAVMEGDASRIHYFRAFSEQVFDARKIESETPTIIYPFELQNWTVVPNLEFMVPMALIAKGFFHLKTL